MVLHHSMIQAVAIKVNQTNNSKHSLHLEMIRFLGVPFDVINQAQKLCRYANSALEHEDIGTAIKNCEQVLQLLRPYQ